MMDVVCDKCGKRYRVDEEKIKGEVAKFKCRACENSVVVHKPKPAPEVAPRPAEPSPGPDAAVSRPPSADTVPEGQELPDAEAPPTRTVRFGLSAKIIILMLLVSLLPLVIFWGIAFMQTSDRIRRDAQLLMGETAGGLASHVDEWLDKNIRVLKTAAKLGDIISMDRSRQEPILKAIQKEYPWMYLVFTVDPDGMNVARDDGKPLKDYSDRQYYKDVIQGKSLTWQTLIGKTSKKPALVVAVPIKSGNTTVGVMAMAATIDDISKSVAKWKKGRTGFAFLVDEKGKVVAHQVKQYVLTQRKLNAHPLISAFRKKGGASYIQFKNEKGRSSIGHVKGTKYGWALAIQQQEDEILADLRRVQLFAVGLLVATIVLVSLIAWLSARQIVTPIRELTGVAEQMSLGDLNVEIDVKSKDEIGLLAQAIGRMQTSLRLAMGRLRKRR
jgi:methyl-accepting chemotaxis protein